MKLTLTSALDFISEGALERLESQTEAANLLLENGQGAGNDFLGWVHLPSSLTPAFLDEVQEVADDLKKRCEVVIVAGIGGSYLGARAVNEALSSAFDAYVANGRKNPYVVYAGNNIGEDYLAELMAFVADKQFGIINISKSGTTTETALAFRLLKTQLEKQVGKDEARRRIVAVTDRAKGALRSLATQEGYRTFVIPDNVGGRFSVLTPVGLLAIAVAGGDIRELVRGAQDMEKATDISVPYKVTNTGSAAGKGVAQIYVSAPWEKGQVEKSHVVLGGFGKTKILEAGATETLEIKINRDYFTSYDYKGEKAYILDAGEYKFYLSDNAHSWAEIDAMSDSSKVLWKENLSKKMVFTDKKDGKRPTDKSEAVNKEDEELNIMFADYTEKDQGEGFAINFTRSNFRDSFPVSPKEDDMVLTNPLALKYIAKYDVWADENNPIKEMPTVNVDATSYTLSSMRGVDFNDPKWDDFMNQFSRDKMVEMVTNGGWNEKADVENGVPESYDADSPYGYYAAALSIKNINKWYCGDPMVAATFNVELARELGDAFGEEAHANQLAGGSLITGIYGYGLNMHRSAFGGRNYEYYSEDGVLAGKMAAAEAGGASEKGLITFMKHYCLNDQETNRQKNGYCSWVNEQAFREVYLKGWELYMKESTMTIKYYEEVDGELTNNLVSKTMSGATGIMTSYNRIGATWGGASISIHGILEDEFGFTGTAITDAGGQKNTYMTSDFMLRRGGHLTLTNNGSDGLYDTSSPTAVYHLKDATKHILFNKANSNCVQGISPSASIWYETSPWKSGFVAAWVVVGVLALADVAYIVLIALGKVHI